MSCVPESPAEPRPGPLPRPRWRRVQLPVRTLLLVIAAMAVWMTVLTNDRHIITLNTGIAGLRVLSRELFVSNPDQFAVVHRIPVWYDEAIWDVHVPQGTYRLALATRELPTDGQGPATVPPPVVPGQTFPITSGRHTVALESSKIDSGWRVVVRLDGEPVLTRDEPAEWNSGHGSYGGAQFSVVTQSPADKPLILYHRRFMVRDDNGQASVRTIGEGIHLRIEPSTTSGP